MAEMMPQQCPLAQGSRPACADMQGSAYLMAWPLVPPVYGWNASVDLGEG